MLKGLAGQVGVSIVPRYYELITSRSHVEDLSGLPMLDIAPASLSLGARFLKRIVRHRGVVGHPVGGCPVLRGGRGHHQGHQRRPGLLPPGADRAQRAAVLDDEVPHHVPRRRVARRHELDHLNEVDGPLFKVQNDPRVTRVGRFLRRTSLDEFPQLINVWKGDMSLVGPRPFVVSEAMEIEGWARKRFEARPGMTGLWQVSGRNELSHLELCRLDYLYVASWSFWWDMQILWQTPSTIFRGRGAS